MLIRCMNFGCIDTWVRMLWWFGLALTINASLKPLSTPRPNDSQVLPLLRWPDRFRKSNGEKLASGLRVSAWGNKGMKVAGQGVMLVGKNC